TPPSPATQTTTTSDGHDGADATKHAPANTTTSDDSNYISGCCCSTRCGRCPPPPLRRPPRRRPGGAALAALPLRLHQAPVLDRTTRRRAAGCRTARRGYGRGAQQSQQLGPALGVALIRPFVATATNHYLPHHGSTAVVGAPVHGFTVGYWWAAGVFWAGAVICSALIRGGHPTPPRGRPTRAPRRDRQRTDLTQHVVGGAPTPTRIAAPPTKTRTTRSIADSIPPEALMRFGFIRPGNMAQAIASQLQPVVSLAGGTRPFDTPNLIGYPLPGQPAQLFFSLATDPGGRQTHLALRVEDEATVRLVHEFATAAGAEILHEPRLWPEYGPDYYAVFTRDPAGNNLELKCQASTGRPTLSA